MKLQEQERACVVLENSGQKIFGILEKPSGEGPFPAVLLCHGFAANKAGQKRQYVKTASRLAEEGMLAFRFDYRGCGDSEGEVEEMSLTGNIGDAVAAMEWLSSRPDVDASRIGVLGRSMGGPISIQLARHFSFVKSLCLWSPVSDSARWRRRWRWFSLLPSFSETVWLDNVPYSRALIMRYFQEYFDLEPSRAMADLGHIPLLHVHGEKDIVVTQDHLEEYVKYRENAQAQTDWLRLPESDHAFHEPSELKRLIECSVDWFRKTL